MRIINNASLRDYNTFGLDARAEALAIIEDEHDLPEILSLPYSPVHILGGGSNILLVNDLKGLVLVNRIRGKKIIREDQDRVEVSLGGGEDWHSCVLWALKHGLGGIENLSLIPGTAGAAPIQNIGAYGVELKDVFSSLEALELDSGEKKVFDAEACRFGYRDSIFKKEGFKGRYLILRVNLVLHKSPHRLNTSYGAIQSILKEMAVSQAGIRDISEAVIKIRQSKLPDPAELGNSGSFFKNPEIPESQFEELKHRFPNMVGYSLPENKVKVPAGWLIEACGWKGKRIGNTGSHAQQALVLVNYGGATGKEILDLAHSIQASVEKTFGIKLHPEVNVWGMGD
jgi:UDP-N-acetylmuramate dehydrogenase